MRRESTYAKICSIINPDIEKVRSHLLSEITLPETISSAEKIINAPSKFIRSVTAILYLKSRNITLTDNIYSFLSVIELVHNASLIHDDVIDESPLRRGEQTLNARLGNKLAVITGDYLLAFALEKINRLGYPELITLLSDTLKDMCLGEISQNADRYKFTTIDEYLLKSERKTARLFETAINGALILAGEKPFENDFGKNFGIIFQIRDDLKNITAHGMEKPLKSDIEAGIYTAPVIYSGQTEDLNIGIEKTKLLIQNYVKSAKETVESFGDNRCKYALVELLELISND